MSKLNFNHDAENIYEACGLTEENLQAIVNKANKVITDVRDSPEGGSTPNSKIIERYESELEKGELAILLFLVQDQFANLKSSLVQAGMLGLEK